MKNMKKFALLFAMVAIALNSFGQGMTTSEINGFITDDDGTPLEGASVVAIHTPTGSQSGGITNDQGYFNIPLLDVGGPYNITISYVGYSSVEKSNIYLSLGQAFSFNEKLSTMEIAIAEVQIIGERVKEFDVFDGNRTGAETVIDKKDLERMPSLSGDINDFTRYTPQARVVGDGISFAGMNNRYNSVMIDGTVNNDVFGLASNGMNGGQTGVSAFSYESIEQFQIVLAPYDVRNGGFAGAGINAVTKSGTNRIEGSVYFRYRNQGLAGKTPTDNESAERTKLPDFTAQTYGFNLGGPIIKNKLFFYANVEMQNDQNPRPFDLGDYIGDSNGTTLQALRDYSINNYNYDPGTFGDITNSLKGRKFFIRFDWNINNKHKLMIRNQYTFGESTSPGYSDYNDLYYSNSGVLFPSTTNTTAIELKSRFSPTMSNNLKVSYAYVHDNREVIGDKFPGLIIDDGSGTIHLGGEVYSTGNELTQKILTITDNFQINKGKHTITVGTHNEFYNIYNLFMRRAYGYYGFDNIPDFEAGTPNQYRIGYSLVDDIRGDGSAAAADFNAMQLGFYVQDEFKVSDQFKVTYGLRLDIPVYSDQPLGIDGFNDTTIAKLETEYDMMGAQSGQMPFTQFILSPRVGFNWDVTGEKTTQLRGGVGIFTSRVPFVWPAGSYTNNGRMVGDYRDYGTTLFETRWDQQYVPPKDGSIPSGSQIDIYAKDFKLPQMLRIDLSVDHKLPGGVILTIEGLFTKTLNNVLWKDVNMKPAWGTATGTPDNRPLYTTYRNGIEPFYGQIMLGANTNKGYAYNITAQFRKNFMIGLNANLAYTYGTSTSIFDGTSSQNSSQWNYLVSSPVPRNSAEVGIASFDPGHRIVGNLNYAIEYVNHLKTTLSLSYFGQSGSVVSYIYDDYYGDFTSEAYQGPQLIYIPASSSEIVFADAATASSQWAELDDFISSNDYLNSRRGQYAERNGSRLPFENRFDFRIAQDVFMNAGDRRQTLQITFDIFNVGNMINKNWGRVYYATNGNLDVIEFIGMVDDPGNASTDETLPTFAFTRPTNDKPWRIDDSGLNSSRWQAQLGIRYIF